MASTTAALPHARRSSAQIRSNGRKQYRQGLKRDAWVVLVRPGLPRQKISTLNISPTGVGFTTDKPLESDARFTLRLRVDDESGGLYLCRVKHCEATLDGRFQAGAEFVETVPNPASPIPMVWLSGIKVDELPVF